MKHLRTFENFNINEENIFRKFTTGHDSKEGEKGAESTFMDKLIEVESEIKKNPSKYAQGENWEKSKASLIEKAKENRFRGSIRVQRGGKNPKLFVVYDPKMSGLQNIASGASSRTGNPLGGKN